MSDSVSPPQLLTAPRMAAVFGVPYYRVKYVLANRAIQPTAKAGIVRLYDRRALTRVRYTLNAIDAKRCGRRASDDQ